MICHCPIQRVKANVYDEDGSFSRERGTSMFVGINKPLDSSFLSLLFWRLSLSLLLQTQSGKLPCHSRGGFVLIRGLISGLKCSFFSPWMDTLTGFSKSSCAGWKATPLLWIYFHLWRCKFVCVFFWHCVGMHCKESVPQRWEDELEARNEGERMVELFIHPYFSTAFIGALSQVLIN